MKKYLFPAAIFCALLLWTLPASADSITTYTATLTASQDLDPITQSPPVSTATGSFTLTDDTTTGAWSYTLTFTGLTSDVTMAHIHLGPPGVTGPIMFILFDYGMPPSTTTTGETVSGTLTASNFVEDQLVGVDSMANALANIEAGEAYVNVHSVNYPDGEIRGQILASPSDPSAPEPASAGLILTGFGLGAFALFRRQQTKATSTRR